MTGASLGAGTAEAVRDLILVLADSKRLLGYRYAEWMLGAPELETGIACSSMAQDEWGHARLLYALLKDFDDDVEALEHGREPSAYHSMPVLDAPAERWSDLVALMVAVDGALSVQLEAARDSAYDPLRQRTAKMLDEERFHAAHGEAWVRRLAESDEAAAELRRSLESVLDPVLAWFGPDSERARRLVSEGVVDAAGTPLRDRLLARLAGALDRLDLAPTAAEPGEEFDEARRRSGAGGPDGATIRKVRGDRNRAFLMD